MWRHKEFVQHPIRLSSFDAIQMHEILCARRALMLLFLFLFFAFIMRLIHSEQHSIRNCGVVY